MTRCSVVITQIDLAKKSSTSPRTQQARFLLIVSGLDHHSCRLTLAPRTARDRHLDTSGQKLRTPFRIQSERRYSIDFTEARLPTTTPVAVVLHLLDPTQCHVASRILFAFLSLFLILPCPAWHSLSNYLLYFHSTISFISRSPWQL